MAIALNHTIVAAEDPAHAATFLSELFGLAPPGRFGHFHVVEFDNGVSLDFMSTTDAITGQHYAFLVTEADFDEIFDRIRALGVDHWADPGCTRPGEINHSDGGRGVYFPDPNGHLLEIITRPYGSAG